MTEHTVWNDEALMAWADGELSQDRVVALEAAMEQDEALAQRAAWMMETRSLTQAAWAAELDAPVPEALRQSVQAMVDKDRAERTYQVANVDASRDASAAKEVAAPAAPANAQPSRNTSASQPVSLWGWLQSLIQPFPMALAASMLCAGLGYYLGAAQHTGGDIRLAQALPVLVGQPLPVELARVLSHAASGQVQEVGVGNSLAAVATYATAQGSICREFAWSPDSAPQPIEALACRQGDAWLVQAASQMPVDTGFAPAQEQGAFAATLGHLGAGRALSADEEQQALQKLRQ